MLLENKNRPRPKAAALAGIFPRTKSLYDQLLAAPDEPTTQSAARVFLQEHLDRDAAMPCELPADPALLEEWMTTSAQTTGEQYARYLEQRKAGKPRRLLRSKAHALHFLQAVAPTKLVDGAWLYGTLVHWQDPRFHPLIRTYLEELGDGVAQMNHVVLYRQLLTKHGCGTPITLPDDYYVQGTLQLALGYHAEDFLPELIGYNLGYEQLPLHLLISAFELHELDIDPYYFTLHVTIDNAHSGHARQALQSVLEHLPTNQDRDEFLRRMRAGFQLNELGPGSTEMIRQFDLHSEVMTNLEDKSRFGQQLHSDFCKLDGRTVNQWLSRPEQIPDFLEALQQRGWIKRGEDPGESRFWNLIAGPDALMFGVFTDYEQHLIYEWIADDWLAGQEQEDLRQHIFKPARGSRRKADDSTAACPVDRSQPAAEDLTPALERLRRELASMPKAERMQRLIQLMNPSRHSTPEGLLATRLFSAQMY
ncbi:MAG: iron-containing redox enzyme family protein [Halopseudomonas sp.]